MARHTTAFKGVEIRPSLKAHARLAQIDNASGHRTKKDVIYIVFHEKTEEIYLNF